MTPTETIIPTINFYFPSLWLVLGLTRLQKTPTRITDKILHDLIRTTIGNSRYKIAALKVNPDIITVTEIFRRLNFGI